MSFTGGALLTRLRRRDPDALRAVVDAHARRLYRAARGLGHSRDDAEDLVQDVFVTFLETLDRFEGRADVGTWLFGILYHKVQERNRQRLREERYDPIDAVFESSFDANGRWRRPPADPERALASEEAALAIRDCLGALPQAQREVFWLRQVEELSGAAVSKILGHTVTHVGVLLHRARQRLRQCLDGKGWKVTR